MEERLKIYGEGRELRFQGELKNLEEANISECNKELIKGFQDYLFSTGAGSLRVAKLSAQLRNICLKLNKDLNNLTKKDIVAVTAIYNQDTRLAEATKADYRRCIKQFFLKWYKYEDPKAKSLDIKERDESQEFYRYLMDEVSTSYKKKQIDPNSIINEDDLEKLLIQGCRTAREKAFISILHESGARSGEFLNITLGDITIKENFVEIPINGKTGRRTLLLIQSLPYLLQYLANHPFWANGDEEKMNKESYLWLNEVLQNQNVPLLHRGAQLLINRTFERAKLNKKHNLHWFRHSRASILAPRLTEQILCKVMGWTQGSRQIRTYSHLSPKQIESAIFNMYGLSKKEEEGIKPIKCVCGSLNAPKERYCFKCFKPLKTEIALQDNELIKTETGKSVKVLMEIMNNDDLRAKFEAFTQSLEKT